MDITDVPVIRVVEKGAELFTLNNRRLAAFQAAKIESVPIQRVYIKDPKIFEEFREKFNPICNGEKVAVTSKSSQRKIEEKFLRLNGKIE